MKKPRLGGMAHDGLEQPESSHGRDRGGVLGKVEAGIVREALQRYGTQTKAAKHLGVGQATIARKARLLDLADERRVISE